MKYSIFEGNVEKLERKLKRIQKKCNKYDADFHYEIVGEEFKEHIGPDGKEVYRYIIVDVSGFAKIHDWEFVASIDHHAEGNVIRNIIDVEIPVKYWNTNPVCEHCNTNRRRNDTFLVRNVKTGEFKQVGRSCLRDYTGGYDAELAAAYIEMHDCLIEGEKYSEDSRFYSGYTDIYFELNKVLVMSKVIVDNMGFVPSQEIGSSKETLYHLQNLVERGPSKLNRYLIDIGVDRAYERFNDFQYIEDLKRYYIDSDVNTSYMQNMKTIFKSDFCKCRDYGYIISAVYGYNKELDRRAAKAAAEAKKLSELELSHHIGDVGDKVSVKVKSGSCVSINEDGYGGLSYLYKFIDVDDNVIMWSTGKSIETDKVVEISGKVKYHREYRGVKQTWLTRCKVSLDDKKLDVVEHPVGTFDLKVIDVLFEEA